MMQRYFIIQPCFADPDAFCDVTVGSGRARANIQIYVDPSMLEAVAMALVDKELDREYPVWKTVDEISFHFQMSLVPVTDAIRKVRFQVAQRSLDDGAPFYLDIAFELANEEAADLSSEITKWLQNKSYSLSWKLG